MPVFAVANYLARSTPPPTPYLILRVDVDYRESHAVQLARLAARYHVYGSFYFRHRGAGFDLDAMHAVAALGHEVGYHFEALDSCWGDFAAAESLFLERLAFLRAAGLDIRTVASHGTPPVAPGYRANYDLFLHAPDLLSQAALVGETTLSLDFSRLVYISDAGWRWRRYVAYVPGQRGQHTSLHKTIRDLTHPQAALYINFHPHQWFAHPASALYFRARHLAGRALNYMLPARAVQSRPAVS